MELQNKNHYEEFYKTSKEINRTLECEWNNDAKLLSRVNKELKAALQGEKDAEEFFVEKIKNYLDETKLSQIEYPGYYKNLVDAVYQQNWGFAGVSEWFSEKYKESSSAKIIGDRIYFLINGESVLMPQTISKERRVQLVAKLLSIKPDERKDKDVNEIYLIDGTRVTIFNASVSKKDQDSIVFRRYIVPEYTFEEQAKRGTIPKNAIPLFKEMVKLGYNIAITGAVRTAKSTFLATWQSYEKPELEGVLVETDPEIPINKIMPKSPIMQIVADEEQLKNIVKHLLRSDSEYIIMAEARDGVALDTAVRIANKGTRRCKMTFHNRFPYEFVNDVSAEIIRTEGGDLACLAEKVAQSMDYIFHFIQLSDKSKKRLDGIYELTFDIETGDIITTQICKYIKSKECWTWNDFISKDKKDVGEKEDDESFAKFQSILSSLYSAEPMIEKINYTINYRKK